MTETETAATETLAASTEGLIARLMHFVRTNKEFERFWKFAVVGMVGAVIDYGTFTGLNVSGLLDNVTVHLPFGLPLTGVGISGTIAFTLAVISNFIWNRFWTYPDSRSKPIWWQLVTFFAVNIVGIIIRIPILEFLSKPFAHLVLSVVPGFSSATDTWLGESAAWALAVVIVMFWNFFVNRYWTYNDVE